MSRMAAYVEAAGISGLEVDDFERIAALAVVEHERFHCKSVTLLSLIDHAGVGVLVGGAEYVPCQSVGCGGVYVIFAVGILGDHRVGQIHDHVELLLAYRGCGDVVKFNRSGQFVVLTDEGRLIIVVNVDMQAVGCELCPAVVKYHIALLIDYCFGNDCFYAVGSCDGS